MKRIYWQYGMGLMMTVIMLVPGAFLSVAPKTLFVTLALIGAVLFVSRRAVTLMVSAVFLSSAIGAFAVLIVKGDVNAYTALVAVICGGLVSVLPRKAVAICNDVDRGDYLSESDEIITEPQFAAYLFSQAAGRALLLGSLEGALLVGGFFGVLIVISFGHDSVRRIGRQGQPRSRSTEKGIRVQAVR